MGNNADYMLLGYGLMAFLLLAMIAWMAYRFRQLDRESALIDQVEAEERANRS